MKTLVPIVAAIFAATSFCACNSENNTTSTADSTVTMTPPALESPAPVIDTAAVPPMANENVVSSPQTGVSTTVDKRETPAKTNTTPGTVTTANTSTTNINRKNPETDRNPLTNSPKDKTPEKPKYKHNSHDSVDSRFGIAPAK